MINHGYQIEICLLYKKKGNEISKIEFENNENIYSYEIQNISNQILNDKKNPNFPSITFEEIEINTKILSHWINLGDLNFLI